ncbi:MULTISPECIES: hypothetical protein [Candidatus Accumulibacter]|jgi:hypothetical protein|uniref:hypothetical protein n=1 Tax=Candidatus Accumulibacter TaxID=327159 RepID=UPI00145F0FCF|nr:MULTISPECIES: hypothetical protein [Candidatus Accumulibacter]HRF12934.1 hypothetical protein [Candidatus Accumulibacter phosphatis]
MQAAKLEAKLEGETWGILAQTGSSMRIRSNPWATRAGASTRIWGRPKSTTERAPPGKLLTFSNGNAIAEFPCCKRHKDALPSHNNRGLAQGQLRVRNETACKSDGLVRDVP